MSGRTQFINELLTISDEEKLRAEIRQFLIDVLDITAMGPVEPAVQAAYTAFEAN